MPVPEKAAGKNNIKINLPVTGFPGLPEYKKGKSE
jgi:hypothetical protein